MKWAVCESGWEILEVSTEEEAKSIVEHLEKLHPNTVFYVAKKPYIK
jgi:predicted small metal-binding protein